MIGEEHTIANFLLYTIVFSFTYEETFESLRTHIGFDGCGVESLAGAGDRAFVEIRCENLEARADIQLCSLLEEQYGKSIRFLARCTSNRPDADLVCLLLHLKQSWDHLFIQCQPRLMITEEVRHADQDIVEHGLRFIRVMAQKIQIALKSWGSVQLHTTFDAAQDGGALVLIEILTRSEERR